MATERLTDNDKDEIVSKIGGIAERALYNKKFPVKKAKVFNWISKQMKPTHRKAYLLLTDEFPALVNKCGSWQANFIIKSKYDKFTVDIRTAVPVAEILIKDIDRYHADIITWCEWYQEMKDQVNDAHIYARTLVYACTTVGQVKRLFPDEILRFVPSHLLNFSDVERRSRVPNSLSLEPERFENMMQTVAIGALSPDEMKGLEASVSDCERFAEPE
jgi:hypothetical protein